MYDKVYGHRRECFSNIMTPTCKMRIRVLDLYFILAVKYLYICCDQLGLSLLRQNGVNTVPLNIEYCYAKCVLFVPTATKNLNFRVILNLSNLSDSILQLVSRPPTLHKAHLNWAKLQRRFHTYFSLSGIYFKLGQILLLELVTWAFSYHDTFVKSGFLIHRFPLNLPLCPHQSPAPFCETFLFDEA